MAKDSVVIVGGGPAGSTCACFLRKYAPDIEVTVLERERFPRDHVGESQLPPIGPILDEIGVWDKIEAANFPIKIGATYRWGNTKDLWDFELYPARLFKNEPRPAMFKGQRTRTAFQVDRSVYDQILLDHAAELGADVRQETKVVEVVRNGDTIDALKLSDQSTIDGGFFVDASGHPGILRRAMGVAVDSPTTLQNIAIWDYWTDAEWAITIGSGGTRVQILSLGYGWIWFIPISPTRSSVGLVLPAETYKKSGKRPDEIYRQAIQDEPLVRKLLQDAQPEGKVQTTKDWSFVAQRMSGENWYLCGESAGFADPILSAGMTLAQAGARELAYTIIAKVRGHHDATWLDQQFAENQSRRLIQHIRFADFWYAGNGCFTDLKEFSREIAADAGLELNANDAFQWLGTGGFTTENVGTGIAGFPLGAVTDTIELVLKERPTLKCTQFNRFRLNLEGAQRSPFARYENGSISAVDRFVRNGKSLPVTGAFALIGGILEKTDRVEQIIEYLVGTLVSRRVAKAPPQAMEIAIMHLEAMVNDGWVVGSFEPGQPMLNYELPRFASNIHPNQDMPKMHG